MSVARRASAWGVHLLTASSAPAGVVALLAIARQDAATAFWCMAYTLAIDSIDGTLARAVEVKRVVPSIDGARLDDIVDYFTYVIVPAMLVVQMGLVPDGAALPVAAAITLSSAYGFSQVAAKTTDHFFTGFPSYWNVVAFYLYLLGWPPAVNAAVLLAFAVGVFVPIRYLYPSRTPVLRPLTVGLGMVWAGTMLWVLWHLEQPPHALVLGSLAYPLYYVALSLALSSTDR